MASFKGHIWFGLFTVGLLALISGRFVFNLSLSELLVYTVIGLLFALLPDVDISSWSQRLFYSLFLCVDIYLIYIQEFQTAAYFGLILILPVILKHRGWTHSKAAMFIIPSPILIYPMWQSESFDLSNLSYYTVAVAGYFSHLILDRKVFR